MGEAVGEETGDDGDGEVDDGDMGDEEGAEDGAGEIDEVDRATGEAGAATGPAGASAVAARSRAADVPIRTKPARMMTARPRTTEERRLIGECEFWFMAPGRPTIHHRTY